MLAGKIPGEVGPMGLGSSEPWILAYFVKATAQSVGAVIA